MHLRDYPKYFEKNGERRAAYFTVEATELLADGWVAVKTEKPKSPAAPEPAPEPEPEPTPVEPVAEPEKVEVEIIDAEPEENEQDEKELPDFEFMTKSELIKYAEEQGVELKTNQSKAELVEACKAL